jgi:3-oxoacyl-[acyl-carrier-protein] synthase III
MSRHVALAATGAHAPTHREVTNDELRERFAHLPGFVDKMEATTGILTRWYAPESWATSDLVLPAAREALERAGIAAEELDLLVVGTDSPDYVTPATSVVVQDKLGARQAGTFDVGCACASFPTALAAAAGIMATNPGIRRALVVGAYMMHKLADPTDPTIFFYGDGAGAAVLVPSEEPGLLGSAFKADGAYARHWGIFSGGTAEPATGDSVAAGRTQVRLVERYPPEVNDAGWPYLVRRMAQENGFSLDDIDLCIFTQVRKTTIEKVLDELGIPREKGHFIMHKWGYTGSACLPMALHDAVVSGRVQPGQLVVLVGSGVGYNQAGASLRITEGLALG